MKRKTYWAKTRISEVQAKNALRKANPDRQYAYGSYGRFQRYSGNLIDLFAMIIERRMDKPANSGRGCRVTPQHIENSYAKLQKVVYDLLLDIEMQVYGDEEE